MKILKFCKKKNGQYLLVLEDDRRITLHEDLILKNDLLLTKEISEEDIIKFISQNNNYSAYNIALKYITIKMRSVFEVNEYLKKKEISESVIDKTLKKLIEQGYLNDWLYCKSYVNDRINLSKDGPLKILEYLKKNKITDSFIEDALSVFDRKIEYERVEKIINKQTLKNTNKSRYLLKQKIFNDLINLGYHKEVVVGCLNEFKFNEEDIYKKEYEKLYQKLSKKYSGKELEYKLKQKLYQKGFFNINIDI